jgi:hypothetical protein
LTTSISLATTCPSLANPNSTRGCLTRAPAPPAQTTPSTATPSQKLNPSTPLNTWQPGSEGITVKSIDLEEWAGMGLLAG